MKNRLIFLFFFFSFFSFGQQVNWIKSIGAEKNDYGTSITTDMYGNIYTVGYFSNTVDFGFNSFSYSLTSKYKYDLYILKISKDGDLIWVKSIGGDDSGWFTTKNMITVDSFGNCYIIGRFIGQRDFDTGLNMYNIKSKGESDIFILKLNKNGNFLWVKSFGSFKEDSGYAINIDNSGDIYATGIFNGKVDFNPDNGVFDLISKGKNDIFILKLDSLGNFIWAKSFGGNGEDNAISISNDNNNDVYLTGNFQNTVDVDFGTNIFSIKSEGKSDVFILKLDSLGNFIWVKSFGGLDFDSGVDIKIDESVYVSGEYRANINVSLGMNQFNINSKGETDIFITKLNKNGDQLWVKSFGGIKNDYSSNLQIDENGFLYAAGSFTDTMEFDIGINGYKQLAEQSKNIFVLKLDSNGELIWVYNSSRNISGFSNCYSISLDIDNNIYATGAFETILDFDSSQSDFLLSSTGKKDAFILKLSQCPTSFDTMQVQTCDSYTWIDGKTYTESIDTAEYILTNVQGCDSIVSLDLTIYKKDSIGIQTTACNEYIWKDDTLKNTDIYRYDTLNIYGCDSTVTLDLTINKSSDSSFKVISCDSYIWHDSSYTQSGIYRFDTINAVGCDSTITLDLTLNSSSSTTLEKSACESFTWHDSIYTSGGTYRFDTVNITGCDSTVTLNLTIVDKIENLDTMYICQGDTIEIFDREVWENKLVSKTFTSQKGCDSIQNIQVVVKPLPEGTITESICEGDSIFVVNRWLSEEGTYIIHKENEGECDSLYSVNITLRPLKYSYDTIDICKGDTIEVFGFEISTETDVEQSYVGSNDCDSTAYIHITILPISSSQSQITLCPGDSILIAGNWIKSDGKYQEHLTGINGCDSIANIQVKVLTKPEEPSVEIDCDIPEILLSTTAATPWHIQWDNGDTTNQSTYQNQSQAILTLQTDMGCKEIYTIALPTLPDLAQIPNLQDTTIDLNQTLSLNINANTSNWQIDWTPEKIIDCPNCANISINPVETTVINLSMTHSTGCTYSREFTIRVQEPELEIPNIFTPNGDGINDNWKFRVPKEIKLISCTVFDRWGEKIYQTKGNTPINWDGKYKTSSVLSGVYIYIIEYVDSKGENRVLAGDVTVVR